MRYSIDYYQREYRWEEKHIHELVADLTEKFREDYDPAHSRAMVRQYSPYFLGPIIISNRDGQNFIVDGQQRLTSLTLLLIFLNHLQKACGKPEDEVPVESLVYSTQFGEMAFNLDVDERQPCMEALFRGQQFDGNAQPESVHNIASFAQSEQLFRSYLNSGFGHCERFIGAKRRWTRL